MRLNMKKLVLIDGNSIMNRAFYGIMGSKMLTTKDGKYTNAIYGFLAIMFKIIEDVEPEYIGVAFDLKGPTERHKLYEGYKANRKGMPNELAEQMPIIKQILEAMNIDIIEKQGYEGDDLLGTLAKYGEKQGLKVTILSGDRDTFQLASKNITIRIPRTKAGKTEQEEYDEEKIKETYGIMPKQLIEVKALQGDTSDNIPGVPGIGEKTALTLIQQYDTIDELYEKIEKGEDTLKGKQKENIVENKELAYISKTLGTINTEVPIEDTIENLKLEEWDKEKVLEIFKELRFNKYIERFNLKEGQEQGKLNKEQEDLFEIEENTELSDVLEKVKQGRKIIYYLGLEEDKKEEKIIKKEIRKIAISIENKVYYLTPTEEFLKEIFENKEIEKYGHNITEDYIILKQKGIKMENIKFDTMVAAYILNPTNNKYEMQMLLNEYLEIDENEYLEKNKVAEKKQEQMNLFEQMETKQEENKSEDAEKYKISLYAYGIKKLEEKLTLKLEEINAIKLFQEIDMPTVEVLSDMQWNGMYVDEKELEEYGKEIKERIEVLTKEIYELCETEFNINSTKQLGEILFEKLKLPVVKKNKSGYSTDVDVLEKLREEHPVIEKLLEYRQVVKLNSTYVEGLKPYINPKTKRIHSFFHQTITATGRISSTEPNLQNIPTRMELGKRVRKVFKPEGDNIYLDADYSQIELRVLAHISEDTHMIQAFKHGEDIHKQAASKVLGIPIDEVTKEQRSEAKAVNFGIVYGISDFGLGEQLGMSRKKAKVYIDQYLSEYSGIKKFMDNITEEAKKNGYVETLFNRRRYIPELSSNNYMVRQFGSRAAMNTPIQGTAADIMKIAMIRVYRELKNRNLKSKIVLQVHDEMMIEVKLAEIEDVREILQTCMESAIDLKVPLIAELSEAKNWYDCK
ncbi:MAG: DNA polymerase I [Clostridia bacterium]|nr:DNA polymerase I [Clostridia bacterium]